MRSDFPFQSIFFGTHFPLQDERRQFISPKPRRDDLRENKRTKCFHFIFFRKNPFGKLKLDGCRWFSLHLRIKSSRKTFPFASSARRSLFPIHFYLHSDGRQVTRWFPAQSIKSSVLMRTITSSRILRRFCPSPGAVSQKSSTERKRKSFSSFLCGLGFKLTENLTRERNETFVLFFLVFRSFAIAGNYHNFVINIIPFITKHFTDF